MIGQPTDIFTGLSRAYQRSVHILNWLNITITGFERDWNAKSSVTKDISETSTPTFLNLVLEFINLGSTLWWNKNASFPRSQPSIPESYRWRRRGWNNETLSRLEHGTRWSFWALHLYNCWKTVEILTNWSLCSQIHVIRIQFSEFVIKYWNCGWLCSIAHWDWAWSSPKWIYWVLEVP